MHLEQRAAALGGFVPVRGAAFAPVPEHELAEVETLIGLPLPDPYRQLLLKFGGVALDNYIDFTFADGSGDTAHFSFLYGGDGDDTYALRRAIHTYRDRMPPALIPIGDDGGGNKICLGVSAEHRGRIYYWDHGREWDEDDYAEEHGVSMPQHEKFSNVRLVANSLDALFDQMFVAG